MIKIIGVNSDQGLIDKDQATNEQVGLTGKRDPNIDPSSYRLTVSAQELFIW